MSNSNALLAPRKAPMRKKKAHEHTLSSQCETVFITALEVVSGECYRKAAELFHKDSNCGECCLGCSGLSDAQQPCTCDGMSPYTLWFQKRNIPDYIRRATDKLDDSFMRLFYHLFLKDRNLNPGFNVMFGYFLNELRTTRFNELYEMVMMVHDFPRLGVFGITGLKWSQIHGYEPATSEEACQFRLDYVLFVDGADRLAAERRKATWLLLMEVVRLPRQSSNLDSSAGSSADSCDEDDEVPKKGAADEDEMGDDTSGKKTRLDRLASATTTSTTCGKTMLLQKKPVGLKRENETRT